MVGAVSNCADAVRLETAPTGPGAMRFGLEGLINSQIYYTKPGARAIFVKVSNIVKYCKVVGNNVRELFPIFILSLPNWQLAL